MSRRVLEARFRKVLGHTPHEEIVRVQIGRVKELLAHTDLPLGAVAHQVGYAHPEYLSVALQAAAAAAGRPAAAAACCRVKSIGLTAHPRICGRRRSE